MIQSFNFNVSKFPTKGSLLIIFLSFQQKIHVLKKKLFQKNTYIIFSVPIVIANCKL